MNGEKEKEIVKKAIWIDPATHRRFKIMGVKEEFDIGDKAETVLTEWMDKKDQLAKRDISSTLESF